MFRKWLAATYVTAFTILLTAPAALSQGTPEYGPPKGTLVIVGGGNLKDSGIYEKFIDLAGGKDAKFVIVPTAGGNRNPDGSVKVYNEEDVLKSWKARGLTNVHMLHTADPKVANSMHEHINSLQETLSRAGYNRQSVNADLQRSIEQARKALHEALSRNGNLTWVIGPGVTNLDALTLEGLNVGKGTTLTVTKNANSAKSIAKADETGTYVIVSDPKKRLTVHDNVGKLIFDGEIETDEQQQKVPPEIWTKAKAMLDELGPAKGVDSEPEARTLDEPRS